MTIELTRYSSMSVEILMEIIDNNKNQAFTNKYFWKYSKYKNIKINYKGFWKYPK